MLKTPRTIAFMKNLFDEVVIAGSGPTSFDYNNFCDIHEPVFFINDMHVFAEICPSEHKYFFTHHPMKYQYVKPIPVHIQRMFVDDSDYQGVLYAHTVPKDQQYIQIDVKSIDDTIDQSFLDKHKFLLDRDEVAERNMLLAGFGSATTAIHAAWFAGAKKVTFIGCNPDVEGIQRDPRIGGKLNYGPDLVKANNRMLPKLLGLNFIHY